MSSTVRSRPNHYETLGLTPAASGDEITQAFVRRMSPFVPRPMAAAAQISAAYETLRNPARRRAYDALLGLGAEPEPRHPVTAEPAPPLKPHARSETLPERRMGSFIAESLREPVKSDARDTSPGSKLEPQPPRWPEAEPETIVEPHLADLLADRWAGADNSRGAEGRPVEWMRAGVAVGALVLAVGLLGALAGWQRGSVEEPQQAERAVSIALPPPKPLPSAAAPSPAPIPTVIEAQHERSITADVATVRNEPQPTVSEDKRPEVAQSEESQPEGSVAAQTAAEAPPVAAVATNLPLPNAVIARTIERIGYSCGQVASTTAVEGGASGTYKVTCTSGQSYQAKPVRGRYHFRRWGRGG